MSDQESSSSEHPLLIESPSSRKSSISTVSVEDAPLRSKNDEEIKISYSRGVLIFGSLGMLIFLQACNMSLITTTQSKIASDLDAFEKASWFTSAYLNIQTSSSLNHLSSDSPWPRPDLWYGPQPHLFARLFRIVIFNILPRLQNIVTNLSKIAMSSMAPIAGRLSQIFAPRNCFFVATVIIAVGQVITAIAPTFNGFVFGRTVAGLGGAGILTIAIVLVLQLSDTKRRGLWLGMLNLGMTTGVALGAVIAGALLDHTGWRFLFWIQAPLALLGGLSLLLSIPNGKSYGAQGNNLDRTLRQKLRRLDYIGAGLLASTITLFLFGLSSPKIAWIPVVISLIILPLFILHEAKNTSDPIIPMAILKSRGTLLSCLATLGVMMARWSVLFYTPVYAIAVREWRPASAGSLLIPTNAGFGLGGLLAGWLHIRRAGSFYIPSLVTFVLFPISLVGLAVASNPKFPVAGYVLLCFANGLITGSALNYTLVHLLHLTPPQTHPVATALLATFRGFAGSFGSSIGSGIFARILGTNLHEGFQGIGDDNHDLIRKLMGSPALVGDLQGTERAVAIKAYQDALRGLWLAAAGFAALMIFLQAGVGWKEPESVRKAREEHEQGARAEEEEGVGEEGTVTGT